MSITERIEREVLGWPGVEARPHRFGEIEFRVRGREIGHLHGDRWVDLPFPVRVREELVAAGKARPHHVLPRTGWVRTTWKVALELFRLSYERLVMREKGCA